MSQPSNWKTYAPAWIPLVITVMGWAYFVGVYVNQQETNTDAIASLHVDVDKLESSVDKQGMTVDTNSTRLDSLELALNAIHQIQSDVGVIKNDQGHIQSGIKRMEDDIKDIRKVAYGAVSQVSTEGASPTN